MNLNHSPTLSNDSLYEVMVSTTEVMHDIISTTSTSKTNTSSTSATNATIMPIDSFDVTNLANRTIMVTPNSSFISDKVWNTRIQNKSTTIDGLVKKYMSSTR